MIRRDNGEGTIWEDSRRTRSPVRGRKTIDGVDFFVSGSTRAEVKKKLKALKPSRQATRQTYRQGYTLYKAKYADVLLRPSYRAQIQSLEDNHILPCIGDLYLDEMKPKDLQNVIVEMSRKSRKPAIRKDGSRGPPIPLSASTMEHARQIMYSTLEWMRLNDMVATNPCTRIRIPDIPTTPKRNPSLQEIRLLLEVMAASRWIHSVRFDLLTGLRRGELLALKWENVSDDWIRVRATRSATGVEGPPKTQAGMRDTLMSTAVRRILEDQKEMLRVERNPSPYIFPAQSGKPVMPSTYYRTISNYARKAGLKLTVHELRHFFATWIAPELDAKTMQTIMGHATIESIEPYRHLRDGAQEQAARAVDRLADRIDGKSQVS